MKHSQRSLYSVLLTSLKMLSTTCLVSYLFIVSAASASVMLAPEITFTKNITIDLNDFELISCGVTETCLSGPISDNYQVSFEALELINNFILNVDFIDNQMVRIADSIDTATDFWGFDFGFLVETPDNSDVRINSIELILKTNNSDVVYAAPQLRDCTETACSISFIRNLEGQSFTYTGYSIEVTFSSIIPADASITVKGLINHLIAAPKIEILNLEPPIVDCESSIDCDGDGMPDSFEVLYGLDPNDPLDAALDLDDDGLTNLIEYGEGTDPNNPDTDGDGANDGREVSAGTDPLDPSSIPNTEVSFFEFSNIPNVPTSLPFEITLTARMANVDINTSFNSCVDIEANFSTLTIDPNEICLTNGTGIALVKIFGPGALDTVLIAQQLNVFGLSNTFIIENPVIVPTKLAVDVTFDGWLPRFAFSGTVYLETPEGLVREQSLPVDGLFNFDSLIPGMYKLWAIDEEGIWRSPPLHELQITAEEGIPKTQVESINVFKVGRPPVLVLPGIMGSTTKGFGKYDDFSVTPHLPAKIAAAKSLRILNVLPYIIIAGFDSLDRELTEAGYNVITVPWDWRASLDVTERTNAVDEYLTPALARAKDPNGDGIVDFPKVDVVAHSMGGLVVRSYIQSNFYANDIRRFAMVGTPNQGSANTYPMIQGGEPQRADNLENKCSVKTFYSNPDCFYSRATDTLYKSMNDGESPFKQKFLKGSDYSKVLSREGLVNFYREHVPTGRQLEATNEVLKYLGYPSTPRILTVQPNRFLVDLNADSKRERLAEFSSACSDKEKVSTTIFAANKKDTLDKIWVISPVEGSILYPDGVPYISFRLSERERGDGTVTYLSALGQPHLNTDNYEVGIEEDFGVHSGLMGKFKTQIRDFLNKECE
jgi:hypothetical protein